MSISTDSSLTVSVLTNTWGHSPLSVCVLTFICMCASSPSSCVLTIISMRIHLSVWTKPIPEGTHLYLYVHSPLFVCVLTIFSTRIHLSVWTKPIPTYTPPSLKVYSSLSQYPLTKTKVCGNKAQYLSVYLPLSVHVLISVNVPECVPTSICTCTHLCKCT